MEPTTTPTPPKGPEVERLSEEDEEFLFEVAKDPREERQEPAAVGKRCYCYCHCVR
jgi:hypothetical protein